MKITKFGHACLLVEENNRKLLFDPGVFTFNDNFKPADVGGVDLIIITHNHFDHMSVDAIKAFLAMQACSVIGSEEIKTDLAKEGINVTTLNANEAVELSGFSVEAFPAAHGPMPGVAAENTAYLINKTLLHPGDSYEAKKMPKNPPILALPTQGPWSKVVEAIQFAIAINPKTIIPIHNGVLKEELTPRFDELIAGELKSRNIQSKLLGVGKQWEEAL